jgi:hypothetical protein
MTGAAIAAAAPSVPPPLTAVPSGAGAGSQRVKVEPRPGWLSRVMLPPIMWASRLEIGRPSPVPR